MNVNNLKPGDILLYNGQSMIGKLIRLLDGTEVTHAGVYLGNQQVGEALMVGNAGIHANPFSLAGSKWIEVRRLPDSEIDIQPIITVANNYIADGNRYAYAEILLLASILMTRKINLENSLLGRIAFSAMRKANDWIEDMFNEGREPMICSEFAFRCYDEADPADEDCYSLEILSQMQHSARRRFSFRRKKERVFHAKPETDLPTIHPESLLADCLQEPTVFTSAAPRSQPEISDDDLENLIAEYLGQKTKPNFGAKGLGLTAPPSPDELKLAAAELAANFGSSHRNFTKSSGLSGAAVESRIVAAVADFVTPGDLLKSPSLVTLGRIPG